MKQTFTTREWSLFAILIAVLLLGIYAFHAPKAEACGFWSSCNGEAVGNSVNVQEIQKKLEKAVPVPQLEDSLERTNISKRLQLFSNPAKISYIYLTSYGKVMAFYTVKGKVTSGQKRMTPQSVVVDDCGNIGGVGINTQCTGATFSVEQPELDGTYGSSAPYIYFWTTDGTYVQWNGEYMLADQPLQLTTQPELVRTVK